MCGLAINITSFAHLLKKVDFDTIVDHLALVHILKSKTEPATPRIKRLLEVLSAYSFNLYYMKGKDMILSDFLSRQETNKGNPHEIIPISFDMKAILNDRYYNLGEQKGKYLVQTHSQTKDSGIKVPVLKGTHLPLTIKEIQAGYLNSSYFKDLYLYLSQNILPSSKGAMHKIEILSERYIYWTHYYSS